MDDHPSFVHQAISDLKITDLITTIKLSGNNLLITLVTGEVKTYSINSQLSPHSSLVNTDHVTFTKATATATEASDPNHITGARPNSAPLSLAGARRRSAQGAPPDDESIPPANLPDVTSHGRAANVAQSATGAPPDDESTSPANLPDVTSHGRAANVAQSATGAPPDDKPKGQGNSVQKDYVMPKVVTVNKPIKSKSNHKT